MAKKETYYFSHDYNARGDRKMMALRKKEGMNGVGIYWCVIEMLYEEGGYMLLTEYENIGFELRVKPEIVRRIVCNYELFQVDGEKFWSESLLQRLEDRNTKSGKAKESALEGWKRRKGDANALRTHCDGNAREERKGEEKKEEESKGEKTLAWFQSLFDKRFREDIESVHPGKDIEQAIKEAYTHARASPVRWASMDGPDAKRLLNSWLAKMPTANTNGTRKPVAFDLSKK